MLAHTVTCPNCQTELRLKSPPPEGVTGANCPRCRAYVPLRPGTEPVVAVSDLVEGPTSNDTASALAGSGARDEPTLDAPNVPPAMLPPNMVRFLSPPLQPDEIGRLGPYRILAELGRGGMGIVFRAEDTQLEREVALKVMLPQYAANPVDRARFVREARAQATVEHYHIVQIFQVGESNGVPYLAMPLLRGQSLAAALRVNPQVPLAEAVRIAREMAEGLAAAHEKGLVHRDIKPGNVWLEGKRRRVKILDFGLARTAEGETIMGVPRAEITRHGAIVGTPAYMSPEQAHGERVDGRGDLFSLGIVLYQMLAGRHPFRAGSPTALLIAIATENPPPPSVADPDIPPALDALSLALLAKRPENRPATAESVAEQLRAIEAALTGRQIVAVPVGVRPPSAANPWENIDLTEEGDTVALESEAAVRPAKAAPKSNGRPIPRALVGGVLALLAVVGLAAAFLAWPARGMVAIEFADEDTATRFKAGGRIVFSGNGREHVLTGDAPERRVGTGKYTASLEGVSGLMLTYSEYTVTRGSTVQVRVTKRPPEMKGGALPPVSDPDPDRDAARYVLSVGGTVWVEGTDEPIRKPQHLPRPPFRLSGVDLANNPQVTDAALAAFKGCRNLIALRLDGVPITAAGLANFAESKGLRELRLRGQQIDDAALAHFRGCKELRILHIPDAPITDAALKFLADCPDLYDLWIPGCRQVGDAGVAHLAGCTRLWRLNLHWSQVTDDGFAHLKNFTALEDLEFPETALSSAGLVHLAGCKNVRKIDMSGCKRLDDAAFAPFRDCKNLQILWLERSSVTDAALAHLSECRGLRDVSLSNTPVTDACLEQLKLCPNLSRLALRNTKVTRKGVEALRAANPRCQIDWEEGVAPKMP